MEETNKENMKKILQLVGCLFVSFLVEGGSAQFENDEVYIVYMGASVSSNGAPRNEHGPLLSSVMKRKRNAVLHTYSNGFSGFAARLSKEEVNSIAQMPEVLSVFKDPILNLHTTRSWEFLRYQDALKIDSATESYTGADVILGILDTGIWPESESFSDEGMSPVPSRWKGTCMEGRNFTSSNCNRKVIGARFYPDPLVSSSDATPRDELGHGTHVSSTAAGKPVSGASFYGLANGTARGGSPNARIAMYKVCFSGRGCPGSSILKGFDDAIADGVDVLSLSLGSGPGAPRFDVDPISIGAYHAAESGILVVCSAGNYGPSAETVVNAAPWILTVAATTIDRDLEADILLGESRIVKGGGINFSGLETSPIYPLIDGTSASTSIPPTDNARNCLPGSLDSNKLEGKIVICEDKDSAAYSTTQKFDALRNAGAVGMIIVDGRGKQAASNYGTSPIAAVSEQDGIELRSYINSTSNPVGTILPTSSVTDYMPAPVVAYFSSRGPIPTVDNLIKPDIAAPGVNILAAWPSNDRNDTLPGKDSPFFELLSGTSMACPHVSGLAANIKSQRPTWSPSAIRSAIMTTAIQRDNLRGRLSTEAGSAATPYDVGSGEMTLSRPLQPGLVYETEGDAYVLFFCGLGYGADRIRRISSSVSSNFSCPAAPPTSSSSDLISQMNYPSIGVSNLRGNETKAVNRTVTNVGEEESVYTAATEVPNGKVAVTVNPSVLEFAKGIDKLTFQVSFTGLNVAVGEDIFGSITWSSGNKYSVRSPFVVRNAA